MDLYDALVYASHVRVPMDLLVSYTKTFKLSVSDVFKPTGARSGSLNSTRSFAKVAADKARSIVLLANKDDP